MKRLLLIIPLLSGCATWGARESKIILPSGQVYSVHCQADGQFRYRQGDIEVQVDNRGRPGFLEQVLGTTILGTTGLAATAVKEQK